MTRWTRPLVAALLVAVTAACGLKPGTHVEETATQVTVVIRGGAGEVVEETAPGEPGAPAGPAPSPATAPPSRAGRAPGQERPRGEAPAGVLGSDRTGVTSDRIVVAVHAPVTGAAPLPSTSFERARDLYWRQVIEAQGQAVLGRRRIDVLFRDDRYQPNTAVQACRELEAQAFLIVGGGGTDQIQACGRFAEQADVPYFSAGVTEAGLRGLSWYFAASMSYRQQGGLLADFVARRLPGRKVAAIVTDTPNFDDAVSGWEEGVRRVGLDYYRTLRHPKGDTSWYNTFANELQGAGVQVVYVLSSPVDYIRFAQQAGRQGFRPQYVGVGVSMGLNAVLGAGCPDVNGGIFFSPFPGLDWARQNEPAFFQAAQRFGTPSDDLALALWGLAKTQHEFFKRYEAALGTDLTREDFRRVTEQQQAVRSGLFPALSYRANDHFGAEQVHVLQADCGRGEHTTVAAFASRF